MLALSIIATVILGIQILCDWGNLILRNDGGCLSLDTVFAVIVIWILYAHIG